MNFLKFLLGFLHVCDAGDGRSIIDPIGALFNRVTAEGPIIDPNGHA